MNLFHLNDPTMAILNSKQTIDTITKRLDYTLRMKWIEYRNDHKHDSNTQLFPRFFKWIKNMTKVYTDPLSKTSTTNTSPPMKQPAISRNTSMPSYWTGNAQANTSSRAQQRNTSFPYSVDSPSNINYRFNPNNNNARNSEFRRQAPGYSSKTYTPRASSPIASSTKWKNSRSSCWFIRLEFSTNEFGPLWY